VTIPRKRRRRRSRRSREEEQKEQEEQEEQEEQQQQEEEEQQQEEEEVEGEEEEEEEQQQVMAAWADHHHLTPLAAMAGVRVLSVAASFAHSLALTWDGRVYSWGHNGGSNWVMETTTAGLRRRWWRGSRACAASLHVVMTVWQ
jgi:alpha-tubulin suppressor-like RCC1 family protein